MRRPNGSILDLNTAPTYLLANLESAWKIFAFLGPDDLTLAGSMDSFSGELI